MRRKTCEKFFINTIDPCLWKTYGNTIEDGIDEVKRQSKEYVFVSIISFIVGFLGCMFILYLHTKFVYIPLFIRIYLYTVAGGFFTCLMVHCRYIRYMRQRPVRDVQLPYYFLLKQKTHIVSVYGKQIGANKLTFDITYVPTKYMIYVEPKDNDTLCVYGRLAMINNKIVIVEARYALPNDIKVLFKVFRRLYSKSCRIWLMLEVLYVLASILF